MKIFLKSGRIATGIRSLKLCKPINKLSIRYNKIKYKNRS